MPISEDRELGDVTAGPAGDLDLRADLNSAIQALTPRQRMVLELRAGNTEATEIGKRLGIHRSTVHEEFNRIRKLFRDKGLKEYIE
jgi:RNA polymerase sigma factor (sigma-70 family)